MNLPLISINHVTVRFLNNTLFNNLNFSVNKGQNWALVGESGSGKSAFLQTIAGRFNITGGNIEYHFLRLMIQEHAPKAVHYDKDQVKDSQDIIRSFPTLSPVLQKAILDYCPHSKLLHERYLNG